MRVVALVSPSQEETLAPKKRSMAANKRTIRRSLDESSQSEGSSSDESSSCPPIKIIKGRNLNADNKKVDEAKLKTPPSYSSSGMGQDKARLENERIKRDLELAQEESFKVKDQVGVTKDAKQPSVFDDTYQGREAYKHASRATTFTASQDKTHGRENPSLPSASYERQLSRLNKSSGMTVRVDYQPHVCKDYYETGFCGYGDSCIFLHDRSEIKMSWQLDKEWQVKSSEEKLRLERQEKQRELEEKRRKNAEQVEHGKFEFCAICSDPEFNQCAVQTTCGHFFCESCVLGKLKTAKSKGKHAICPTCRMTLGPSFTPAQKLVADNKAKFARLQEAMRLQPEDELGSDDDTELYAHQDDSTYLSIAKN